jgi:hypothetical protein
MGFFTWLICGLKTNIARMERGDKKHHVNWSLSEERLETEHFDLTGLD